ncbi:hypothetical protein NZNM25_11340 [Nitrosopumilus zosterae]|uniref:Uncharacterized protein n=1 Tax=Nitrosopumilus zosterae TaxID=718286 RepID=A0A2S2KRR8_9ARCH|nr:hypothetical protein [Nitrosopumilus zosterae]GBH34343.1 hypothetical protein NZNM25_11340 [Nitrosopumilus zosterae]
MNEKFVLFGVLIAILMGGSFGIFSIEDSFAEDNLSVSREDSEAYKKQIEKQEEQKQKAEERKQKLEEKQEEQKQKAEERKQKLEEKKIKLDSNRKKLEEKLSEKINKYEEKLREIKEKYLNRFNSDFSGDTEKFSTAALNLDNEINKKSEEIRKKLEEKQEKLDFRTQRILEKINDGDYLGDKISSSTKNETYELVFDSVTATGIHNNTQSSFLEGNMIFKIFDKSKSNLKLELQECHILVDNVPYNCGFGKARTITSGDSGVKDSLVILAFLEDAVIEEVHSTLKISLSADSPIGDIDDSSQVSILGPQSKISGMWFLDGTGTLTRTVLTIDDSTDDEITVELNESIGVSGN